VIENQSIYPATSSGDWRFTHANDILYNYTAAGSSSTQWTKNNTAMVNQTLDLAINFTDNSSINRTPTLPVSPNSFVINAGTNTGAPTTDQRGFSRNGTTDIGAFEYNVLMVAKPTTITTAIATFNSTSATLGGNVTSDGGAAVTERGVVYSLSGTPDISDTKVQIGSGTGSFSQSVTGLLRGTTYYVRTYATNPVGTAYGSVQSFTTGSGKPVISNLNSDSGTYTEGDAPLALDRGGDATVSNPESNFDGGKLTVSGAIVNNEYTSISPSESLVLSNGMLSGSTITIDGTVIGSIPIGKTGQNGLDLVVSFNANATDQLIGKLLHHIKYHNVAETSNGTRNIYFMLKNSLGLINDAAIVTISTYVANDAPTLTATAINPTFIEGNSSVALFSNASASTVESSQVFTALTLEISNVTDGSFEQLLLDGSSISLTNGTTGTSSVNSLPYSVSVTGTTAIVSITGASLSAAELETLVNSLKYSNSKSNPTEANRVVTISTLKDNGGTAHGGDDIAELAIASSVSVFSGKPVISNLNGDSGTFKEGDSPLLIDIGGNAIVINHSVSGFYGGNLTVSISSASSTETIAIKTSATVVLSNGMNEGSTVSISGTVIGTIATGKDGKTGHDLVVTLNANATIDLLSILIQNITYFNDSETELGSRTVQVTLINATAFISDISTVSITALAVNDAPTLTITGAYPTFTEHGLPVKVYSGATASTVEPGQTFTNFSIKMSNLSNGASEQVVIDGTYVVLTHGTAGTTATNSLTYSVSVSNSIASVTITGGSLTAASLQTVLNNLSYYNSSNSPSTNMNRLFRIQSLKDDGGTANGGSNSASLFINSSVSVVATSLPTVSTSAVTIFDGTSATLGGDVTADGSTTVTERGVVYSSTVAIPTIGTAGVTNDVNGTIGTGAFSKSISNLVNGTLYYVRAYAINAKGTAYGSVQTFTTKTQPTVTTAAISTYDGVSATMGGNVTADGGVSVTERGVVYSSSDATPTIGETGVTKNVNGMTGMGAFSVSVSGLSRGTTYYVCAYATNVDGTIYGSSVTFTTKDFPALTTAVASSVKIHSVIIGGEVTDNGGLSVTEQGIVYSLTDNTPTVAEGANREVNGTGTGSFTVPVTGLIAGTKYYYASYAINSEGISYGTAGSFTTASSSTFTGDTDWGSDANWSAGVPLTGGTAIIEGTSTISSANITVDNLSVISGLVILNKGYRIKIKSQLHIEKNSQGVVVKGD